MTQHILPMCNSGENEMYFWIINEVPGNDEMICQLFAFCKTMEWMMYITGIKSIKTRMGPWMMQCSRACFKYHCLCDE